MEELNGFGKVMAALGGAVVHAKKKSGCETQPDCRCAIMLCQARLGLSIGDRYQNRRPTFRLFLLASSRNFQSPNALRESESFAL
jgi:hypothetical protein